MLCVFILKKNYPSSTKSKAFLFIMYRKSLIIITIFFGLFLCTCGGKNKDPKISPDKAPIHESVSDKKPWWKFWGKKSPEAPAAVTENDDDGQMSLGNAKVDENIDAVLTELQMQIKKLKATLDYHYDDLAEVKAQSKIWTNPFAVYNKEIVLENGSSIFGKIVYQDQNVMKVETLIGQLNIDRNTIVRVVNQINAYNKFEANAPGDAQSEMVGNSENSGINLIQKRIQAQYAKLVLVGDILEQKDASGNTVLSGEVKNVGNKRADFSKIIFTFRMNWHGETKSLTTFINGVTNTFNTGISSDNSILPHAVGNFELIIPKSFGIFIGYNYDIDWSQYDE